MLNCSSMRAAVILSAALLMLGVLLGLVAVTTPLVAVFKGLADSIPFI